MTLKDFNCPICGKLTDSFEQKKSVTKSQKIIYSCKSTECGSRLIQEYDSKNKKYFNTIFLEETKRKENEIWQLYRYKRLTPEQWNNIAEGHPIAGEERKQEIKADKCEVCGKPKSLLRGLVELGGKARCPQCAEIYINEEISKIPITTTLNIDGYKIIKYIEIESIEIVIGTGIFSEIGGGVSDFFGARSTAFEKKLQKAKQTAFKALKYKAVKKGGDAVVGIDVDYTEFSGNRIGLIVNGTIVKLEPDS